MPRKKRKKEKESSFEITAFFGPSPATKVEAKKPTETKTERVTTSEVPVKPSTLITEDLEARLLEYIRVRRKVPKSELYKWSKLHKITPASLYRALISLEKKGLIKKAFDPQVEELAYEIVE